MAGDSKHLVPKTPHAITLGNGLKQLGSGGTVSPPAGPGQSLDGDPGGIASKSSENVCISHNINYPQTPLMKPLFLCFLSTNNRKLSACLSCLQCIS